MTDNRSVAVEARVPELSVIVELDNIRAKGVTRSELALTALAREISSVSRPIEWRIGSPGEAVPLWVDELIRRTGLSAAVATQHQHVVPVGDRRYYDVKNVLAASALGNVLVFVDGDVIPEPGWLTRLTAPFVDPSVDVVCGKTVVGPLNSFYVRSIAATWIYDPVRSLGVERVVFFNANNVAFRRNLFAEREFPDERGQYRSACAALARQLAAEDVVVLRANDAVVLHPAPPFPADFAIWALLSGRDRALRWRDLAGRDFWLTALRWTQNGAWSSAKAAWVRRRWCGLGPVGAVAAMAVGSAMWALRLVGAAICRFRPSTFRGWR